jgi:hypothetical protein
VHRRSDGSLDGASVACADAADIDACDCIELSCTACPSVVSRKGRKSRMRGPCFRVTPSASFPIQAPALTVHQHPRPSRPPRAPRPVIVHSMLVSREPEGPKKSDCRVIRGFCLRRARRVAGRGHGKTLGSAGWRKRPSPSIPTRGRANPYSSLLLQAAAEQGFHAAQYNLCKAFCDGAGVTHLYDEAASPRHRAMRTCSSTSARVTQTCRGRASGRPRGAALLQARRGRGACRRGDHRRNARGAACGALGPAGMTVLAHSGRPARLQPPGRSTRRTSERATARSTNTHNPPPRAIGPADFIQHFTRNRLPCYHRYWKTFASDALSVVRAPAAPASLGAPTPFVC